MKTKLEIINETVAYYSEDVNRRATNNNGGCEYKTEDGRMCAVGRYLIHELPKPSSGVSVQPLNCNLDDFLMDEYSGHSVEFWSCLQSLHDRAEYWNATGLTESGQSYVNKLKEIYGRVK